MPTGRPRSKRYSSEYKSHYKKFESKRPNTVKGELTRSIIPNDKQSISSTPRAGLQSTKLGVIHEPPLQRKRIVPYEKNHNIFPTGTIKELQDREWLDVDNTARTERVPPSRHKESQTSMKAKSSDLHRTESPILVAEKKILRNTAERPRGYPYVPDGVKRRSTYDQDFGAKGHKSKTTNRSKVEKSPIRDKKTKLAIGGKKSGITPDRMAPAGIRTMTSIGDKRLIQPSDNSQYLRSPERENARIFDSEYSSRFKYVDGAWIESPEFQGRPSPVKNKLDWYKEAITRRNEAYGYAKQARGTHFSREELDHQNRLNAQYLDDHEDSVSSVSETSVSHSSKKNKRTNGNKHKERKSENEKMGKHVIKDERPAPRREAWGKRPASPVESDRSFSTSYSGTTETTADQFFLERGRSPTPELRETGQARRHHYDMTTNILNEKLRKSLTFSDEKLKGPVNGHHRQTVPLSARSQDGSYMAKHREDDVMSEVSMASRASTASKMLEKARERRDNFWQKENGQ